jgi:hypothetical protein
MKRNRLIQSIGIGCFVFLLSCKKEEIAIPIHHAGSIITSTVDMDVDYKWQIFMDVKTNLIVSKNLKTSWDLGFEASENGFHIILNTSKSMFVFNTGTSDFNNVTDTLGFAQQKSWDEPSGNLDSTAIGDWRSNSPVYIIDRGYDEVGTHLGFRKIQFLQYNSLSYSVQFSALDNSGIKNMIIQKDSLYNFNFLSFSDGGKMVDVEPPKADWDIVFTQYTHVFYEPSFTLYLVTGCLLNRYKTTSIMDIQHTFDEINLALATGLFLSSSINTIGYQWKEYVGSVYQINSNMNFIIKDSEGIFYKLRFIDFYNTSGVKGSPKFEFQQL